MKCNILPFCRRKCMNCNEAASSKSVWRGIEYYKQNKVLSYTVNEDGT